MVVLTDGHENASETSQELVRERDESCQEEHGWEFLFIGANQDAALTATSMGMRAENALDMSNTGAGARAAYESTSRNISEASREGQTGGFTDDDRLRQDDADDSEAVGLIELAQRVGLSCPGIDVRNLLCRSDASRLPTAVGPDRNIIN